MIIDIASAEFRKKKIDKPQNECQATLRDYVFEVTFDHSDNFVSGETVTVGNENSFAYTVDFENWHWDFNDMIVWTQNEFES